MKKHLMGKESQHSKATVPATRPSLLSGSTLSMETGFLTLDHGLALSTRQQSGCWHTSGCTPAAPALQLQHKPDFCWLAAEEAVPKDGGN